MRSITMCTILVMGISASAIGQVSYRYALWADGPVQHLMTQEETKEWKAIRSDDVAAAFIDLFWARRDPTPDTPRNELHEEFDARVDLADRQFSSHRLRGAMSDPGRVFILLGPPWQISSTGSTPSISSPSTGPPPTDTRGNLLLPSPRARLPRQIWTYAHARKPRFIKQSDFVLVFFDEGNNEWQLAHTERTNPRAILQQAVNALVVSPRLTKAPFPSTPVAPVRARSFRDTFLAAAYKQLRSEEKPAFGPASLTWGDFVTSAGEHFVSAQLYVPAGAEITAGQKVTFFAVIENSAGEIVAVDEGERTMIASGRDAYVDTSIPLEPGWYTATFGLAADGRVLSASRTRISVEPIDLAASGISPLILSNNVHPLQTAHGPTDPFTFGGLKVVPKGDSLFTPSGDLWYFCELRNPGLTEKGVPSVQVQIDIEGKTPKGRAEMKFPMQQAEASRLKGEKNRYALGLGIPLEGFVPGEYTMTVHVVDTVLGKSYDLRREFRVRGPS